MPPSLFIPTLLFRPRPRSPPFRLAPASQTPRFLLISGGSGRRMAASSDLATATAGRAKAMSPVPAVKGDVVVRAGGRLRFADVSLGGLGGVY